MIVDSTTTKILCYGDSNTWARDPDTFERFPVEVRWPGVLQNLLDNRHDVIEEGIGGRTVDQEDVGSPGRNGKTYLTPCIGSHLPVDIVVMMLGTNDLKSQFTSTPESITNGLSGLVDDIFNATEDKQDSKPKIILISPVHINSDLPRFTEIYSHAYDQTCGAMSQELSKPIKKLCEERSLVFVDAQEHVSAGSDGLHLSLESHGRLAEIISIKLKS
jgi:lysophospholipase L1-like esterase